ncbi:MAG: ABC transporter ATP-binding protein/permease [Methylocystis sp.]|uniref:ABC transporter ATP-binding protein/permease n=1 Tax=Methylocystis sp. TaxID=1911079 RepID=UPI003930BA15
MTNATPDPRAPGANNGFLSLLKTMASLLRHSHQRSALASLIVGLIGVIGATAYAQVRLNAWNQPFYDAIERKDLSTFFDQLGVYGVIAGALLILNVAQTWLNQTLRMKLREGLTRDLFEQWLMPRRAFLLAGASDLGENPDQRIHEDAHHLAELSTDLGIGLFQASLLVASFIGVLWKLSTGVTLHWGERSFAIPGYMVWAALFYAGVASFATWRVGRPLMNLNATRYAREAELRFALVHAATHCEGIAVYRGEREERTRLEGELDRLLTILKKLVAATTRLTWMTAGYGWFTIIAPLIVASPAYFGGDLTFGGMLMAAGAFTQVQASLRWFVDNTGPIADWRATLLRVGAFRLALMQMDAVGTGDERIELSTVETSELALDDLKILSPEGRIILSESHLTVAPGERVLVVGGVRSGKTSLFRAIAGLWPWGGGKIELPTTTMFLAKRPYIPEGSLREILAYPSRPETFSDSDYQAALTRLGLAYLFESLDLRPHWDRDLTDPEQQGVAFGRLLLHRPACVVADTAIETLPAPLRAAVLEIFDQELAATALLSIGSEREKSAFYTKIVELSLERGGQRLKTPDHPGRRSSNVSLSKATNVAE